MTNTTTSASMLARRIVAAEGVDSNTVNTHPLVQLVRERIADPVAQAMDRVNAHDAEPGTDAQLLVDAKARVFAELGRIGLALNADVEGMMLQIQVLPSFAEFDRLRGVLEDLGQPKDDVLLAEAFRGLAGETHTFRVHFDCTAQRVAFILQSRATQ